MKNFKEYLLVALALILGAIAIFKLTKGDLLFVPVAEVNLTKSYIVTAKPLTVTGDAKEKDPLGILGTTLRFRAPKGSHPNLAKIFDKTYHIVDGTVKIEKKIKKPVQITLLEHKRYCSLPKEAVVTIGKKHYVLTKEGVKAIKTAQMLDKEIYTIPPCPKSVAIGKDLQKRVEALLSH